MKRNFSLNKKFLVIFALAAIVMAAGYSYIASRGELSETVFLKNEVLSGDCGEIKFHTADIGMEPCFVYTFNGHSYSTFTDRGVPVLVRLSGSQYRFDGEEYTPAVVSSFYREDDLTNLRKKYPDSLYFRCYNLPEKENDNMIVMFEGIIVEDRVFCCRTITEGVKSFYTVKSAVFDDWVVFTYTPNLCKYITSCILLPIISALIAFVLWGTLIEIWEVILGSYLKISMRKSKSF